MTQSCLADTLSEVSNAGVNKVLNKRRRSGHTQPARQRSAIAPSVCGAPALLDQDDQTTIPEGEQEEKHPHHDEDDGMGWESEDEDDNHLPPPPLPLPHLDRSTVITVDATTVDDEEGKPSSASKRKPRITYTKEDKELTKQIHRSHVLCLLGRAMLYDTAADDPTLQALMVSLVPLKILQTLPVVNSSDNDNGKDKKRRREHWTVEYAERIVKWFSSEFKLSPHTSQQQLAIDTIVARNKDNDEIAAALELGEKGVDSIIAQLTTAAEEKRGGGEELVALFVAMMRGLGGLVRSTRVVEPSSLRPGDAVKQEEHAVKRFQNRKQQQQQQQRSDVGGSEAVIDLTVEEKEEEEEMTVGEIAKMLLTKAAGSGKRKKSNASINNKRKKGTKDVDTAVKEEEIEVGDDGTTNDDNTNKKKKKSKGELELELQLAIAMAATAFQQPQQDDDGDANDGDDTEKRKKTTHPSSKPKPQIHRSRSASWSASLSQDIGTFWCELFIGSLTTGKWVHVDPLTCLVNKEQQVEGLRARGSALPYVVSLMGGGSNVKDVTKRYVVSYIQSQKYRDDEWWSETLQPLRKVPMELLSSSLSIGASDAVEKMQLDGRNNNNINNNKKKNKKDKESPTAGEITFTTPPNNNSMNQQLARLLTDREDAELHELELREKMSKPSTISAFKNHPTYVLKRHISKYQCVKPGATFCGCHNGEMYYNKEDITELHTVQKWRQLGSEVVESELHKPAKIVKKRGAAAAMVNNNNNGSRKDIGVVDENEELDDGDGEGEGEGMTQLYGDWQTRELILKGAENGKVPRNERGNVEVPPFAHAMPPGCIHLNLPSIAGICRKLMKEMENTNVIMDYAPALMGFEYRRGGAVPKIEGVVVCEEVHQMVLERYWEDRKEREEKERKKREKEEEEARNMMKKTLEARARLEAGGGGGSGGNGSRSMAEAAKMLVEEQRDEAVPSGRKRKKKQKLGGTKDGEPDLDLDIEEI